MAGEASNDQRRVRVIALQREADMRPERLRQISQSVLGDLQAFTGFEACNVSELRATTPTPSWCG